jgi:hypothetical protein
MNYYLKPSTDNSHDFPTETSCSANPLSILYVCAYAKDFVTLYITMLILDVGVGRGEPLWLM